MRSHRRGVLLHRRLAPRWVILTEGDTPLAGARFGGRVLPVAKRAPRSAYQSEILR